MLVYNYVCVLGVDGWVVKVHFPYPHHPFIPPVNPHCTVYIHVHVCVRVLKERGEKSGMHFPVI